MNPLPSRSAYGNGIGQAPLIPGRKDTPHMESIYLDRLLPLENYDKIIVLFSGGKDSLASVLDLLERGVPRERIELWHHDIDGGHPTRKMDWPVTQNYVRAGRATAFAPRARRSDGTRTPSAGRSTVAVFRPDGPAKNRGR